MTKTTKRLLIGGLVLVTILALAWPKIQSSGGGTDGASFAGPAGGPMRVRAEVVTPRLLRDRLFATGTVRANESVELRSEATGKITEIHFQEGRPVRTGALLIKINDNELQAQLRKAEYRVTLASDREARQRQIYEKGGISLEEYEATLNELNVLRADVELIKAQIDKTEVRAPFNGTVGLRQVSVGSFISTTTPIATLQDITPVKIDFSIPERYAQRVRVSDKISFTVEGLASRFEGTVFAVEPRIEAGTRTLLLRAQSPNPKGQLLPGAFAEIELVLEEIADALTVPSIAVIPEFGGAKVFVVQGGTAMPRPVETGIRTEEVVQITDGVAPGDTVLVSGIQSLRPGLPVIPDVSGQMENSQ